MFNFSLTPASRRVKLSVRLSSLRNTSIRSKDGENGNTPDNSQIFKIGPAKLLTQNCVMLEENGLHVHSLLIPTFTEHPLHMRYWAMCFRNTYLY